MFFSVYKYKNKEIHVFSGNCRDVEFSIYNAIPAIHIGRGTKGFRAACAQAFRTVLSNHSEHLCSGILNTGVQDGWAQADIISDSFSNEEKLT